MLYDGLIGRGTRTIGGKLRSRRHSARGKLRTWRGFEGLEARLLMAMSDIEQELFYDLNHLRVDPQGELAYFFSSTNPDLVSPNAGVTNAIRFFGITPANFLPDWQTLAPTTPVAFSQAIQDAAYGHNLAMIAGDEQSHQVYSQNEQDLGGRLNAVGYTWNSCGENVYAYASSSYEAHAAFAIDWGNTPTGIQTPPGHRNNMMDPGWVEAGISMVPESNASTQVGPLVVTQDFGSRTDFGNPAIIGVIFRDLNNNQRYDAGEGISNVNVDLVGTGGAYRATTTAAGGYQVQVPAGVYTATAAGGAFVASSSAVITVAAANIEVDFISGIGAGYVNFVRSANSAPLLDNSGNPSLQKVLANSTNPPGNIVSGFIGNTITDPDPNAVEGIAVIGATATTSGSWQYSITGGSSWSSFPALSDKTAVLLRDNDLVRFVPFPGFTGTASLQYRAWDRTTGAAGGLADLSQGVGGTTAFSSASETVTLRVGVNVAPILNTAPSPALPTIPEDTTDPAGAPVSTLLAGNVTDPDPQVVGMAIVAADNASGQWQFSADNGATWTDLLNISPARASLLRDTDRIRFVPAANFAGSSSITFRAWDQSSGVAGGMADVTQGTGGATAFSTASDAALIVVTPVNDAPVLDTASILNLAPVPPGATLPAANTVASILSGAVTDPDAGALQGIAIIGQTGSGTWYYRTAGQWRTFSARPGAALLLRAADEVAFVPAAGFTGNATLQFRAWDQTTGAFGATVNLTNPASVGGTTAYSADSHFTTVFVGDASVIQGQVFEDYNASGLRDASEPLLAGWTIYLDTNNNAVMDPAERRTTSDLGGNYSFDLLPPGDYVVRQIPQAGWQTVAPADGAYLVTLAGGQVSSSNHFANVADICRVFVSDVTVFEGTASSTQMAFTISLSLASANPISVNWATADGTATAGSDYTAAAGTVVFAPGDTSTTIFITALPDSRNETDETFTLNLVSATNTLIRKGVGLGTLRNDDPIPSLDIAGLSLAEGDAGQLSANVVVTLSAASGQPVSVDYATGGGQATPGEDYVAAQGTLIFAPGETVRIIAIPILSDTLDEDDESFTLSLGNASLATLASSQATITISDDDLAPSVSVADAAVVEGSAGNSVLQFSVNLSAASGRTITVQYATSDSAAIAGADYTAVTGTLTFTPTQTSHVVAVPLVADSTYELDESLWLILSNPTGASLGDAEGLGTIRNDDPRPPRTISFQATSVGESGGSTQMIATLSYASETPVTVDWATVDITAHAGDDYNPASGTLTFAPGETAQNLPVQWLVLDDALDEADETLAISLSNPVGAEIAAPAATLTITDDDPSPELRIDDVVVTEGPSGFVTASFLVTLTGATEQLVRVDFATADDTAAAGTDYIARGGELTFLPGETSKRIDIMVMGDTRPEADETFVVSLSNAANATVARAEAYGRIKSDEWPTLSIAGGTVSEGTSGQVNAVFTLTLSQPIAQNVSVQYTTVNGTATAGRDYLAVSGTLVIRAGEKTGRILVPVLGDRTQEANETFVLKLFNAQNALLIQPQASAIVINDDQSGPDMSVLLLPSKATVRSGQTKAVTFGTPRAGAPGPIRTFQVRNTGSAPLTLTGVRVPLGYRLAYGPAKQLAPGKSTTFAVRLLTTRIGAFTGRIRIASNITNLPQFAFPVSGQVLARTTASASASAGPLLARMPQFARTFNASPRPDRLAELFAR